KGIKSANVPIVLDANYPDLLFDNPKPLLVGLTIDHEHLLKVRTERLKALGLPDGAKYASLEQIQAELDVADKLCSESIVQLLMCQINQLKKQLASLWIC